MSPSTSLPSLARGVGRTLGRAREAAPVVAERLPLEAAGFYAAILMPILYLPMLGGRGGLTAGEVPVFVALLFVNVGALVLGQGYRRE